MKASMFNTIRWKFIFIFLLSAALTILILVAGYELGGRLLYPGTSPLFGGSNALITGSDNRGLLYPDSDTWFGERLLVLAEPVRWTVNHIGSTPVMIATGVFFFVFFFFLFSKRIIRYLEEITRGIQEIAKGEFAHTITKRSSDELGIVSENINRMSAQLKKSLEEERKAEKTKNDLITGVSHDLRTPLTSILGFLEYVHTDRYKDEVELRYYVGIAYEKALGLKRLVHDLFEYTRINSRGLPLKFEKVNMVDFLEQLMEEFVPALQKKKLVYELTARERGLYIMADGDELVRVYENLLSNAIQYGDEATTLSIHIEHEQDQALVSIANQGEPIPERDLPYIFERFYRVDASRTASSGGTGLGLAITKSIVELHGGRISVESQGKWTTFHTWLPLAPK